MKQQSKKIKIEKLPKISINGTVVGYHNKSERKNRMIICKLFTGLLVK